MTARIIHGDCVAVMASIVTSARPCTCGYAAAVAALVEAVG